MQHIWPLLIFLSFNVKKIFKTNNNLPGLIESICKHFGLYHLKMIFTTRICLHCEVAETAILFPKRLCLNNNMSFLANPCIHWFHSFMKINCFLLLLEIESSDHICEQEEIAPMNWKRKCWILGNPFHLFWYSSQNETCLATRKKRNILLVACKTLNV